MFVSSKGSKILIVIRVVPQLYKQIVRTRRYILSLSPHDHSPVLHKTLTQNFPRRIKLTIRNRFRKALQRPLQFPRILVPDLHRRIYRSRRYNGVQRVKTNSVDFVPMPNENVFGEMAQLSPRLTFLKRKDDGLWQPVGGYST